MRKPIALVALALASALAAACGNSYHPEYHPVSVNQVEQNLSYPVTVQTGAQPAPVVIAPAPAAGGAPAPMAPPRPPAGYDPSDFFNH